MNTESKLIIELWDYFRDLIGTPKRQDAALQLLKLFEEYGIEFDSSDIEGEDDYLDEALAMMLEDEDAEDDSEEDDSY